MKSSGIGGQAVIEGVMMKNKDRYAVAVRKPDNEIEVVVKECSSPEERKESAGEIKKQQVAENEEEP